MKEPEPKEKQWLQDEEVLLYKPYKVNTSRSKTPEPTFIQDKIDNLEKYIKFIQTFIQTTVFYLLPHYKSLQLQDEQDE